MVEIGLDCGNPHVLLLDGHPTHVSTDALKYAGATIIHQFQLPSHSSHITKLLDVSAFGICKRQLTHRFPAKQCDKDAGEE